MYYYYHVLQQQITHTLITSPITLLITLIIDIFLCVDLRPAQIDVITVYEKTWQNVFATSLGTFGQNPFECAPEFGVEDGINDGIESRVGVTQPGQDLEGGQGHAILAESGPDVDHEERGPAQQEDAHDDPDGHGRLVLLY